MDSSEPFSSSSGFFASTHWSVVLQAGAEESTRAQGALEELCRTYWQPVYAYIRRQGHTPPDTEDLTQGFFEHLLGRKLVGKADPGRGRFRSFLLTCVKHYLVSRERYARAERRRVVGRTFVQADEVEPRLLQDSGGEKDPERAYARHWATTLLEQVLQGLEAEMRKEGLGELYTRLWPQVCGDEEAVPYRQLAAQTGLGEGALRMRVARLRVRYRERLREAVAQTVATPEEIDEELRYLMSVLS